jgi:hypothetical protein
MSVFDLHPAVLDDYSDFVRSFFMVADERALVDEARLWPDFLLQVSPSCVRTDTVDELVARGELHEGTARFFRTAEDNAYRLYQHQMEALELARRRQSYVVTSGLGPVRAGRISCRSLICPRNMPPPKLCAVRKRGIEKYSHNRLVGFLSRYSRRRTDLKPFCLPAISPEDRPPSD